MMTLVNGRIRYLAFKVLILVFFGIAIFAAAARMTIRLWLRNRLRLDDYLLLLSCAFLTAATGLLYDGAPSIFMGAELIFNPAAVAELGVDEADIVQKVDWIQTVNWVYLTLSWISIFLVKFGFLWLFKYLVNRLPSMYRLWKGVLIFTTLVFVFALLDGYIACPKWGLETVQCSETTAGRRQGLAMGITAIVMDIMTDAFILAIPVALLWRVRMRSGQKLGLALFLCLSICMILMAIIRVSGIHFHGKFDNTWIFMWQQMEACVAVTMLSLTAFRSVFIAAKPSVDDHKASPWVPSTKRLLRMHKKSKTSGQPPLDDLTIPSATLTGLSRFHQEAEASRSMDDTLALDTRSLTPKIEHHPSTQV